MSATVSRLQQQISELQARKASLELAGRLQERAQREDHPTRRAALLLAAWEELRKVRPCAS